MKKAKKDKGVVTSVRLSSEVFARAKKENHNLSLTLETALRKEFKIK
jgi:hypothetical protein